MLLSSSEVSLQTQLMTTCSGKVFFFTFHVFDPFCVDSKNLLHYNQVLVIAEHTVESETDLRRGAGEENKEMKWQQT